jgi:hypothetical protein
MDGAVSAWNCRPRHRGVRHQRSIAGDRLAGYSPNRRAEPARRSGGRRRVVSARPREDDVGRSMDPRSPVGCAHDTGRATPTTAAGDSAPSCRSSSAPAAESSAHEARPSSLGGRHRAEPPRRHRNGRHPGLHAVYRVSGTERPRPVERTSTEARSGGERIRPADARRVPRRVTVSDARHAGV